MQDIAVDEMTADADSEDGEFASEDLESLFSMAEELIGRMEDPRLPLEEALAAYERGVRVIRACNRRIDSVEKKMLVLNGSGGLEPFDGEEAPYSLPSGLAVGEDGGEGDAGGGQGDA